MMASLHKLQRTCRLFRTLAATASHDEDITLVWPPPSGFSAARPELLSNRCEDARQREGPDTNSTDARKKSVFQLLQKHSIKAPSLAKSNLLKLPVQAIREELQSWGVATELHLKRELVQQMHGMVQQSKPVPVSLQKTREASHRWLAVGSFPPQQVADWLIAAKADDVLVIDVRAICDFTEHMVLATGRSHRHVYTAAAAVTWQVSQHAEGALKGQSPRMEGGEGSDWVTVDIGKVVVHIFTEEARSLYDLEGLWMRSDKVQRGSRRL